MKRQGYDFTLTLAAVILMFLLSLLCIGSMFYFKWAALQSVSPDVKIAFQDHMNRLAAPLIGGIVLILGICVPNRILPLRWLNILTLLLGCAFFAVWLMFGWRWSLLLVLAVSAILQSVVLFLTLSGKKLNLRCEGYWAKVGSSLVHLGLILVCLCVIILNFIGFLAWLFWAATALIFVGLLLLLSP